MNITDTERLDYFEKYGYSFKFWLHAKMDKPTPSWIVRLSTGHKEFFHLRDAIDALIVDQLESRTLKLES